MNKTWPITCPNWNKEVHHNKAHGWLLPEATLQAVGNRFYDDLIDCIVCKHKFSLQRGLEETFMSNNDFAIHYFQYNASEYGKAKVTTGQLRNIRFSEPFDDVPKVYLTPYGGKPASVVPGYITTKGFSIFSCQPPDSKILEFVVSWAAYGKRDYAAIPIWRKLLSSSKEHSLRKDYRSELVELESSFEVFIDEFLKNSLPTRGMREATVRWILKHSVEEKLKVGFRELTGESLSETYPQIYGKWQREVKELRDAVVHRGSAVTDEQARNARGIVFELITRIDPKAIELFAIPLEKTGSGHLLATFALPQ